MRFLMATTRKNEWSDLVRGLQTAASTTPVWATSGAAALQAIRDQSFDLILIDESLPDMPGLDLAEQLIKINPMLNCAVASSLSAEAFHEASEGLGLLAQMPLEPNAQVALELVERVAAIEKLTRGA